MHAHTPHVCDMHRPSMHINTIAHLLHTFVPFRCFCCRRRRRCIYSLVFYTVQFIVDLHVLHSRPWSVRCELKQESAVQLHCAREFTYIFTCCMVVRDADSIILKMYDAFSAHTYHERFSLHRPH